MKLKGPLFTIVLLVLLSIAGAFVYQGLHYYVSPGPLNEGKTIVIPKGAHLSQISNQLFEEGIIQYPWLFSLHLRLRQKGESLRAGEYKFEPLTPPEEITRKLLAGETIIRKVTIPEGLTLREIYPIINETDGLSGNVSEVYKEGELLPETYHFSLDDPKDEILSRMKKDMTDTLDRLWQEMPSDCPLKSKEDLVILASIVEKETAISDERPHVAAVFLNRLRKGMKLQADPTVAYGLSLEKGETVTDLLKKDLEKENPYNTYLHEGLPPTPICNPGLASLRAVVAPLETKDLFFVADGTGGHIFAKSYKEHAKNHKNWRKIRDKK